VSGDFGKNNRLNAIITVVFRAEKLFLAQYISFYIGMAMS
jgi:hypothetical protein